LVFETTGGRTDRKLLIGLTTGDEDLDRARGAISRRAAELVRYALGYPGRIDTAPARSCEGVIVELGDRSLGAAMRIAAPLGRRAHDPASRPIVLPDTDNLLGREPPSDAEDWDVLAERFLLVVCPHCDRKNRVPLTRVRGALPRCGACKKGLSTGAGS
jgi:hypothetical protein